ncbi:MAG: hypothetical protein HKP14_10865 [Bacteroidia bacterium]|nr:hypothetical protein [Bacteroidia bacterium]
MKEETKRKINEWRTFVDELNVQFHLGSAEAKEEFEKQKKKLVKWVDAMSHKLHDAQDLTKEKAVELKTSLEELRVQAALGTAETKDELEEQQKKITKGINVFKGKVAEELETTKDHVEDFIGVLDERLSEFHTRFDLFRLQFHLGKEETKEVRDEKMKVVSNKLHNLKTKLTAVGEEIEDKWEDFSEEIADQWHHLKNLN